MPDPDKRVVVDGVDFTEVFQFPKVLRAIVMAFQPPRLVVALLMIVALVTVGRIWDRFTEPTVAPGGLLAIGSLDDEQRDQALQAVVREYVGQSRLPEGDPGTWEVGEMLGRVGAEYRHRRDIAQETEDDDARQRQSAAVDEQYLEIIDRIDAVRPLGTFEASIKHATASFSRIIRGFVLLRLDHVFGSTEERSGLSDLFVRMPAALWSHDKLFTIIYGLVFLVVMALGGGALCRMSACEFAGQERLRVREAFDFALRSWRWLTMAPLLPVLIAAVLCLLLAAGGWVLMQPWVGVLGGALYGLALLLGCVIAFLIIGYAAGFSLLIPAVACENCDAADALQRSYAYVLNRPLHLLGYGLVALAGLALGFVLVSFFAMLMLNVTAAVVGAVTNYSAVPVAGGYQLFDLTPRAPAAIDVAWHSEWSSWLVTFWQTLVVSVVAAYVFAYYYAASTIVYLLMRRVCDGQAVGEIWQAGSIPGTIAAVPEAVTDESPKSSTTDNPDEDNG